MKSNYASYFFNYELSGASAATDEAKPNIITVLIRSDNSSYKSVWSSIFIDIRGVYLLREFRFFVILVFSVNPDGSCAGLSWFSLIFSSDDEFVVSVIVVSIKLLVVCNDAV